MAVTPAALETRAPTRLAAWGTMLVLGVGYIGVYLCRKNLNVANNILETSFAAGGATVGIIATVGTVAYAAGKLTNGPLVDKIGGRAGFLLSLLGVAIFAAVGGFVPGIVGLSVVYGLNRFAGAASWGAMMKLVPTWFGPKAASTVIALLSTSYVLGGALAIKVAGVIADETRTVEEPKGSWRVVMAAPSIAVVAVLILSFFFVRRGPLAAPVGAHGAKGHGFTWAALGKLFGRRSFLIACALSFVVTLLREAFNNWSTDFVKSIQASGESLGLAAERSTIFDIAGVAGILVMGAAYGRIAPRRRGWLLFGALAALAGVLFAMPFAAENGIVYVVVLLAAVGFLVYGPFSLLSGVMALEAGGKELVAATAGMIDGIGYLASAFAGSGVGALRDAGGYSLVLYVLAALSMAAALLAIAFRPESTPA